jgi:hypothetical protein
MFDVVRRVDGIDASGGDRPHIRESPLDVWRDRRIDIEANLAPFGGIETFQTRFILWTAPYVQESLHRSPPKSAHIAFCQP